MLLFAISALKRDVQWLVWLIRRVKVAITDQNEDEGQVHHL